MDTPSGRPRSEQMMMVLLGALGLLFAYDAIQAATEYSDLMRMATRAAWSVGACVMLVAFWRRASWLVGIALILLVLGAAVAYRPAWFGRFDGARSLHDGPYTLTVTIDTSTHDEITVGERRYRVELKRSARRVSGQLDQPYQVLSGSLDGATLTAQLNDSDVLWLTGECFDFGRARGRVFGPDSGNTQFVGRFELALD